LVVDTHTGNIFRDEIVQDYVIYIEVCAVCHCAWWHGWLLYSSCWTWLWV